MKNPSPYLDSPLLYGQLTAFKAMHRRAQEAESKLAKATKEARRWKVNAEFWHREFMRHHGIDLKHLD